MLAIRSTLTAGVAAGLVIAATGTAAVSTPVAAPALRSVVSPAVQLSAAVEPLLQPVANLGGETAAAGDWIINVYNTVQPWVEYGVNLAAWAVSWLPWPIGLIGPQANILYSGWQPIGQSLAYSAAFLLDRQFDLIIPTLVNGLKTGINNLVQGEIDWVLSFFPPLPPVSIPVLPVFPGATATTLARSAAATPRSATVVTEPATTDNSVETSGTSVETSGTSVETAGAADPALESEAAPTRRAPRPLGRSAARAQRSVPAAAAVTPAQAASEAPTATATKLSKAPKTTRAAKAKPGAAASTRTGRVGR